MTKEVLRFDSGRMGTIAWFLMAFGFALTGLGFYLYRRGAFSHDMAFVDVGGCIIALLSMVPSDSPSEA
jgi:hypothetical protein